MISPINIKICGITNKEDALEAARLGADTLGFIFYPPSPRWIEPERAARVINALRRELPDNAPACIGVFVDETPAHIAAIRRQAGLDGVQFSGDEPPESLAAAQPIRYRGLSLETLERFGRYETEVYLCDTHAPEEKGGTGRSYDYDRLRPYIAAGHRVAIAGGLTPQTVGDIVARLRPWGVDVSSALESSPGHKDHARLRAFIQAARGATLTHG